MLRAKSSVIKPRLSWRNQQGSSLVIAIFILVIMSLLGAALIKILITNEEAFTYEVLGTRAYNAAQSGLQQNIQRVFPLQNDSAVASSCADSSIAFNNEGLTGCSANVSCTSIVHKTTTFYTIKSIGQCTLNGEVTSRAIEVEAKSID